MKISNKRLFIIIAMIACLYGIAYWIFRGEVKLLGLGG